MTAFDVASWIREFEAVGGSYTLSSDGRLSTGYPVMGANVADQQECCRLVGELSVDPVRVAAVRMHLIGRP